MNIIRTSKLSDQQLTDLHRLETACREAGQTALTFPTGEEGLTFLLYNEAGLLSAFSAVFNENDIFDCCALTLPSMRRKGYFTLLLEEFLKESGEADLAFFADLSNPDTAAALEAIGAELWYEEHMMELPTGSLADERPDSAVVFTPAVSVLREDTLYTAELDGRPVGSFRLDFQKDSVYFYSFEISEPLRGLGFGTRIMKHLLRTLGNLPGYLPAKVRLQVSGDNKAALALYRKLGFQIVDTVSCLIY